MKDGFHILMVTDIKGTTVEFEKAKAVIAQRLMMDRQKTVFDKFIEDVKKNYKIDIKKDELAKLTGAPAAPPKPAEAPKPAEKQADAPKPAEAPKPADAPKK